MFTDYVINIILTQLEGRDETLYSSLVSECEICKLLFSCCTVVVSLIRWLTVV